MTTLMLKLSGFARLAMAGLLALYVADLLTDSVEHRGDDNAWSAHPARDVPAEPSQAELAQSSPAAVLARRHAFGRPPPAAVAAAAPSKATVPTPPSPAETTVTASQLQIELIGTAVAEPTTDAMAYLRVEGESTFSYVGHELLGGAAKVHHIAPRHVVLQEGDRFTTLSLWAPRQPKASPHNKRPTTRTAPTPRLMKQRRTPRPSSKKPLSRAVSKRQAMRDGIKKSGPSSYQVSRKMLNDQLNNNLGDLRRSGKAVPHYADGRMAGLRVASIRSGSLFDALGLRRGDVVSSVNGIAIDSPLKLAELFEQLQGASNIRADIMRGGRRQTVDYLIK